MVLPINAWVVVFISSLSQVNISCSSDFLVHRDPAENMNSRTRDKLSSSKLASLSYRKRHGYSDDHHGEGKHDRLGDSSGLGDSLFTL